MDAGAISLGTAPLAARAESWVEWATAPMAPAEGLPVAVMAPPKEVRGTLLYLIRPSLSGQAVRLRLSSTEAGVEPLKIGSVSIATG